MLFFKRRQSCIAHKATGKKLWYPQTVINGSTASTLHIAEQISELSGASPGDVLVSCAIWASSCAENWLRARRSSSTASVVSVSLHKPKDREWRRKRMWKPPSSTPFGSISGQSVVTIRSLANGIVRWSLRIWSSPSTASRFRQVLQPMQAIAILKPVVAIRDQEGEGSNPNTIRRPIDCP